MEQRLNLNDILNARYGWDYAPDPKMKNLLLLNGPLPPPFLDGAQEAAAFKAKELLGCTPPPSAKWHSFDT